MPDHEQDDHQPPSTKTDATTNKNVDPRATDHPVGAGQAAENAAEESPS